MPGSQQLIAFGEGPGGTNLLPMQQLCDALAAHKPRCASDDPG